MSDRTVSIILNADFFHNFINNTLYTRLEDILYYVLQHRYIVEPPSSMSFVELMVRNNIDKSTYNITLYTNDKIVFSVELSNDTLYVMFKFSVISNKKTQFYKCKKTTFNSLKRCVYDVCDFKDFIGSMPAWDCNENEEYINNDKESVILRQRFE